MSRIGSRDTGPELRVRSLLHRLGYRFRLQRRDLPGTPDIVLPRHGKAIFVHGCFWHGHACKIDKMPKSRMDYWEPKIVANRQRDARKRRQLAALGWRSLVVWECETLNETQLALKLLRFLDY
jgi:DNA mismatch endonuclease (patch repair protein)